MTTTAPSSDNFKLTAFPSPVPPPVTKAIFPLKVSEGSIVFRNALGGADKYLLHAPFMNWEPALKEAKALQNSLDII